MSRGFRIISRAVVGLTVSTLLLACSQQGGRSGITGFGDTVLTTVGYTPESEEFNIKGVLDSAPANQSPEQEYYLGRAVAAQILLKYDLLDDSKVISYLNQLLQAIVAQSDLPNTFGGYHVTVLNSDDINAVSVPGGLIFISRGMLEAVKDEDTLAAVLAHEVTHVGHHHGIRSLNNSLEDKFNKAPVPLGLNCEEVLLSATFAMSAIVDEIMGKLFESGYAHEFEFDADKGAVKVLRKAGYNPAAVIGILATLQVAKNTSSGGWFSTHPTPEERIEAAEQVIAFEGSDEFFKLGLDERNRRFSDAMANVAGYPSPPARNS